MKEILFICVHNSGRSQMAEALFNYHARDKARAHSAGTRPAKHLDRNVVAAMKEIDIDISTKRPKMLTQEMLNSADILIAMGCSVDNGCPVTFIPAENWALDDPEGKSIEEVSEIRDRIESKVKRLILELEL
jgi:protein-tyrosine-phosphatase